MEPHETQNLEISDWCFRCCCIGCRWVDLIYRRSLRAHNSALRREKCLESWGSNAWRTRRCTRRRACEVPANIFSADLDDIRERVEGLRWVRYATVQRVFPDTISIKVIEREPVGLARIRGEIYQFDAQAELLDPDTEGGINFPDIGRA